MPDNERAKPFRSMVHVGPPFRSDMHALLGPECQWFLRLQPAATLKVGLNIFKATAIQKPTALPYWPPGGAVISLRPVSALRPFTVPAKVSLSPNRAGWKLSAIVEWLEARGAAA